VGVELIVTNIPVPEGAYAPSISGATRMRQETKKADVAKRPEVFQHVGLLDNKQADTFSLLFT